MRQLMGNKPSPLLCFRCIPSRAEYDMMSHGERLGIYSPGRLFSQGIVMNPHLAEVVAKAGFEEETERRGQGLTTALRGCDRGFGGR